MWCGMGSRQNLNLRHIPENWLKLFIGVIALALLMMLSAIDQLLGPQASVLLFYFIPIALVTWYIQRPVGFVWAAMSVVTRLWLHADNRGIDFAAFITYWNCAVEFIIFIIFTFAISKLHDQIDSEKNLARTDPLTKLRNRRAFMEYAELELDRCRRYGRPITSIYIDVDNFKFINDTFGHKAGDALLCLIASTVEENVRRSDVLARIGGDEFALLLPETGPEGTQNAMERIHDRLRLAMKRENWPVTFSIGSVTFTNPPLTIEELMYKADVTMYSAKQGGKDRIQYAVENVA